MKTIHDRLVARRDDAGMSLIEILVAMMIFAMLAIGIAFSLASTMTITRDNKARQVASNLAAAEIDAVRAVGDPFKVKNDNNPGTVVVVGSDRYTVKRTTAWVTPGGGTATCGTSGGALQFKRVSVEVSWANMRSASSPVLTDTLLAPSKRINDPTKGSILVSVKNAQGLGSPNVSFTVTSSAGSLTTEPTDVDGCSFILQAPPGNYTVKLNTAGYIDFNQQLQPEISADVGAGSSAAFSFQYDKAAKFDMGYASNNVGATPKLPSNMATTFINTFGTYLVHVTSSQAKLHPYEIGYQAFAGSYAPKTETVQGCPSVDPEAWEPDTRVSPALVGIREAAKVAAPGASVSLNVPMGLVDVAGAANGFLTAVSQPDAPVPGQPSCVDTMTLTFGNVVPTTGSVRIALPYGSWKLSTSATAGGTRTVLPASRITVIGNGRAADSSTGLFVLDPRTVAP